MNPTGQSPPASPGSSIPQQPYRKDKTDIISKVQVIEGFYIADGRKQSIYGLSPDDRHLFLTKERQDAIPKPQRSWCTHQFTVISKPLQSRQADYWSTIDKATGLKKYIHSAPVLNKPASDEAECFAWRKNAPETSQDDLSSKTAKLPEPVTAQAAEASETAPIAETATSAADTPQPVILDLPDNVSAQGKKIAVYNADLKCSLQLTDPFNSKRVTLAPGESVLFIARITAGKKPHWQEAVRYALKDAKLLTVNPLVRDEGPLACKPDGTNFHGQKCQGELFVTAQMVSDLVADRHADGAKPNIFNDSSGIEGFLKSLPANSELTESFVLHHTGSEHMLAVRLLLSKEPERVICYMHETLGEQLALAVELREEVAKALINAFPGVDITLLFPEPVIQRDFSSCGVFTLEALQDFDSGPKLDRKLRSQARKAHKKAHKEEASTGLHERFIRTKKMPARLMKLYQGPAEDLSPRQKKKVVSGKATTLKQYIKLHRKKLPKLRKPSEKSWINLASLRKRYQYLNEWYEKHGPEPTLKIKPLSPLLVVPERKAARAATESFSSCSKPEKYREPSKPQYKYSDLLVEGKLHVINEIIKTSFPAIGTFDEEDVEWNNVCRFATIVYNPEEVTVDEATDVAEWIKTLVTTEARAKPRNRLIRDWLNVSKKAEPGWYGKKLREIPELLAERVRSAREAAIPAPMPARSSSAESSSSIGSEGLIVVIGRKRPASEIGLPTEEREQAPPAKYRKLDEEPVIVEQDFINFIKTRLEDEEAYGHIIRWTDRSKGQFVLRETGPLTAAWYERQQLKALDSILAWAEIPNPAPLLLNPDLFLSGNHFVLNEAENSLTLLKPEPSLD